MFTEFIKNNNFDIACKSFTNNSHSQEVCSTFFLISTLDYNFDDRLINVLERCVQIRAIVVHTAIEKIALGVLRISKYIKNQKRRVQLINFFKYASTMGDEEYFFARLFSMMIFQELQNSSFRDTILWPSNILNKKFNNISDFFYLKFFLKIDVFVENLTILQDIADINLELPPFLGTGDSFSDMIFLKAFLKKYAQAHTIPITEKTKAWAILFWKISQNRCGQRFPLKIGLLNSLGNLTRKNFTFVNFNIILNNQISTTLQWSHIHPFKFLFYNDNSNNGRKNLSVENSKDNYLIKNLNFNLIKNINVSIFTYLKAHLFCFQDFKSVTFLVFLNFNETIVLDCGFLNNFIFTYNIGILHFKEKPYTVLIITTLQKKISVFKNYIAFGNIFLLNLTTGKIDVPF